MALNFLEYFGQINYDFTGRGEYALMTDFTKNIEIRDTNDVKTYTKYIIQDGERPDTISFKLYGDPKYHWSIFLINKQLRDGLAGWPLSISDFNTLIESEYDPHMFISGTVITHNENISQPGLTHYHYSSLPLNDEFSGGIELLASEDEINFYSLGSDFVRSDFKRLGLIFTKPTKNSFRLRFGENLGIKKLYLRAKDNEIGQAWSQLLASNGYPTIDISNDARPIVYNNTQIIFDENEMTYGETVNIPLLDDVELSPGETITLAPFEYLSQFSYENLKNSTYQYYNTISFNDSTVDQSISHFDVISQFDEPNFSEPSRITFYEYENILNDRKRDIIVVKPEAIRQLEEDFNRLILT